MLSIFWSGCSCRKFEVTCQNVGLLAFFSVSFRVSRPSRVPLWCPHREQPTVSSTSFSRLSITQSFWNAVRSLHAPCWEPDKLKSSELNSPSRCFSGVTTRCRCCAHLRSSSLGGFLPLESEVFWCCLFVHQSRQTSIRPRPLAPPPSPVWGLSVCVSISNTGPGLIPSLGDRANLSGETAD